MFSIIKLLRIHNYTTEIAVLFYSEEYVEKLTAYYFFVSDIIYWSLHKFHFFTVKIIRDEPNVNQVKKKKKNETPLIYFNTNYRTEMKLVLINMDYGLLQFDALKFSSAVRLHGESLPKIYFL